VTGSIYLDNPGVDRHHCVLQYYPLCLSQLLVSCTLAELSYIQAICVVHRGGYPFISSHAPCTLLQTEPLFLRSSVLMPCEVQRIIDYGMSTFLLQHFTMPWSELRGALWGCDQVILEIHLEAVMEWIWKYTWRPQSCELGDTLRRCDQASLKMHLEATIVLIRRP